MEYVIVLITFLFFIGLLNALPSKLERYFYFLTGGYMCITLCISLFNPYNLYKVSTSTYLLICFGFVSFWLGYICNNRYYRRIIKNTSYQFETLMSSNKLRIAVIISYAIMIYLSVIQFFIILAQGALLSLKVDFFEMVFDNNSILYFFYQCLAFPVFYLSSIVFSYVYINRGFSKKLIIYLIYVIMFCYVGGKRGYFQTFFEIYIITYILSKLELGYNVRQMITSSYKAIIILLMVIVGAAYMTSLSSGEDLSQDKLLESSDKNAKNLIIYNIGAYRAFDIALKSDYVGKSGGFHYGLATLGGCVEYYASNSLTRLGVPVETVRASTMTFLQNEEIRIGQDTDFNFLYTSFMYFYYDFGIIGIMLFSFLFGYFVRLCINIYKSDKSVGSFCLVCYMFISCILFPAGWFNVALSAQPTLLLFYFIRKKQVKKQVKRSAVLLKPLE